MIKTKYLGYWSKETLKDQFCINTSQQACLKSGSILSIVIEDARRRHLEITEEEPRLSLHYTVTRHVVDTDKLQERLSEYVKDMIVYKEAVKEAQKKEKEISEEFEMLKDEVNKLLHEEG